MAGETTYDRSLEETPTWAVAVVCFGIVLVSIIIEHVLELIGEWFHKKHKKALYEALMVVKTELMLLGFISLLLTFTQDYIIQLCIPKKVGNTWHPCPIKEEKKKGYTYEEKYCGKQGKVPLVSKTAIHQLHIFIFVLAVCHVLYCIFTMALGRAKMRKWNNWEKETKSAEYQFTHDPDRFRYARDTTFGRRHMSIWSRSTILLWITCFFRQFVRSVPKVDYLTLRHGFIMAHLAPQSAIQFDFQKYMRRSLDEDFKVVVGISPVLWFFSLLFLMASTNGWRSYLWLPFIPLIIVLAVGTKLQVIITQMGLHVQDRGDVVQGVPTVKPADDLFWFRSPRLILYLIHFVLFQNAFQVAFFIYTTYEFGLNSCYHQKAADVAIRISMGIFVQILCSYVTLPLYALVTQMGSNMKTAIFNPTVAVALKKWHHQAKKQIKESRKGTPTSSMPSTPHYGMSPVHLLHNKNHRSSEANSPQMSPMHRNYMGAANDHWDSESPSPMHDDSSHNDAFRARLGPNEERRVSPSELIPMPNLPPVRSGNERSGERESTDQHEISIGSASTKHFSFAKRPSV
ncbi:MLO-like protein 6 isoform X1 [Papaver somniferum]|uniref:MLO-like protein 6 isoform X1 n=2 Tax=Papaver somniferum TaxID=3469 RepID=UPI000E6FB94B|nr:MLO-like protein 6 isoform X1 [Papaver somniferum]